MPRRIMTEKRSSSEHLISLMKKLSEEQAQKLQAALSDPSVLDPDQQKDIVFIFAEMRAEIIAIGSVLNKLALLAESSQNLDLQSLLCESVEETIVIIE